MEKQALDEETKDENGTGGSSSDSDEVMQKLEPLKPDSKKKKAKKTLSGGAPVGMTGDITTKVVSLGKDPKLSKNSRQPRNRFGRGKEKKGGGGGKGVWGKPGSELVDVPEDERDPNYDSDSTDTKVVVTVVNNDLLTQEDIEKLLHPIMLEYYQTADVNEVIQSMEEANIHKQKDNRYLVPKIALEISMDHKPSHRELLSVLISDLCDNFFTPRDLAKAFDNLVNQLPDMILDIPDAPVYLGNFIARAIADDCIPPAFVQNYKGKLSEKHAMQCLTHADNLLTMKHGLVRLDNVWGVGGGIRPVNSLIRQMNILLEEYASSNDLTEAQRCLKELEVPHFHHELVYEALVLVIEKNSAQADDVMMRLLKELTTSAAVTFDQLKNGFIRIYDDLEEITLDVPSAHTILQRFLQKCHNEGVVNNDIKNKMPEKGKKRYKSEGDGGKIKC